MCLAGKYDKVYPGKKGYKILIRETGELRTGVTSRGRCKYPNKTTYIRDGNTRPILVDGSFGDDYPAGFHVFTKKSEATRVLKRMRKGGGSRKDYELWRVAFRKQVAYGWVCWCWWAFRDKEATDTVVAKEFRLLEEVKL